jgi:hypothetical protein
VIAAKKCENIDDIDDTDDTEDRMMMIFGNEGGDKLNGAYTACRTA